VAKRRLWGKICIQTDRVTVVHPATEPVVRWCSVCQRDSAMVVPEEAARCWNIDARSIYRWMEAGVIHFLEVPGGVLVCLSSIRTSTSGGSS
jgi:hypothetical protein